MVNAYHLSNIERLPYHLQADAFAEYQAALHGPAAPAREVSTEQMELRRALGVA